MRILTADDMVPEHPDHFGAITDPVLCTEPSRWIGRCRDCRSGVRMEGFPVMGTGRRMPSARPDMTAVVEIATGKVYATRILNAHDVVSVRCGECLRWTLCKLVHDGGAPDSKRHTCGARCTNATGPACDCKCRGANHGSGH